MISSKPLQFTESVIREMTRQALLHNAVNLSQGFPDFPAPPEIKAAAIRAIEADVNQYSITWGSKNLRNAIAARLATLTSDQRPSADGGTSRRDRNAPARTGRRLRSGPAV